jgi:hypothetical protein
MKTDNLTAQEAERALKHGYKVQPLGWDKDEYLFLKDGILNSTTVEPTNDFHSLTDWFKKFTHDYFFLVTTDEDVAKWRYTQGKFSTTFIELGEVTQSYWRDEYATYLTTLPELTEGVVKQNFTTETVSDEVIEEWYNVIITDAQNKDILGYMADWDDIGNNEKELVRTAYHNAHEKEFEKQINKDIENHNKHLSSLLESHPSPQAYKFPYTKIFARNEYLLGQRDDTFTLELISDPEALNYICEAINEKLNRK